MRNVREDFWVLRGPFDRSIKKDVKNVFKAKLPGKKKAYYYWEKIKGYAVKVGDITYYLVYNNFTKMWMVYESVTGMKIWEEDGLKLRGVKGLVEFRDKGSVLEYEPYARAIQKGNGYKYRIG